MRHPKLVEWERKLTETLNTIDDYLEDVYGSMFQLHPARASRGSASNKSHDGLFNIGASFTAGYGSQYGRGYVVDIDFVTLDKVPKDVQEKIELEAMDKLKQELPKHFPGRDLEIDKDGNVIKIHGDLSLGFLS